MLMNILFSSFTYALALEAGVSMFERLTTRLIYRLDFSQNFSF